jgi:hypothetical protein
MALIRHVLQPHRVRMAHNLIVNYGLYKEMDIFVSEEERACGPAVGSAAGCAPSRHFARCFCLFAHLRNPRAPRSRRARFCFFCLLWLQRPPLVDHSELTRFHSNDYISFLRTISPDNMHDHLRELQRCECRRRCRCCSPACCCRPHRCCRRRRRC